jgi:hypothetical protein
MTKLAGFNKLFQLLRVISRPFFLDSMILITRMERERQKRKREVKKGIKPGPMFSRLPIPSLWLARLIITDKPIRNRLMK